jgi:hypothetical protein
MARYLIAVLPHGWDVAALNGRNAQILDLLIDRGAAGLSAAEVAPGVRLAAHIERLRKAGVPINTVHERHGGPFAGHHARYRLAREVKRVPETAEARE